MNNVIDTLNKVKNYNGTDIKAFVDGLIAAQQADAVTHITILVDRSGSMNTIAHDMEGGLSTFIKEQALLPGKCVVSLFTFDNTCDKSFGKKNIAEVGDIKIHPRGGTALIDALYTTLGFAKEEKETKNIFIVVTDGGENSSTRHKRSEVSAIISELDKSEDWVFVFLGANQDSFGEAASYGMSTKNARNYTASTEGVKFMSRGLSHAVSAVRGGGAKLDMFNGVEEEKV